MSLKETIQTEACYNNRQGYGVRGAAAFPSRASGAQDSMGLQLQGRPNRWGSEFTRFHGLNVMSCKIGWKVSEVYLGLEGATVKDEVLVVVLVTGLKVMNHIGLDEEDTLGSSVGSFDGITYEKKLWVHYRKCIEGKDRYRDGGIRT